MADPTAIFVIDTSSVVQVRRIANLTRPQISAVYDRLEKLVREDSLFFPPQVLEELERFSSLPKKGADHPLQWARRVKLAATRIHPPLELVREVLEKVPRVLDFEKPSSLDEADPYVLALALHLRAEGQSVRVVTEERVDNPVKMSIATAAGILELPSVPIHGLLSILNHPLPAL